MPRIKSSFSARNPLTMLGGLFLSLLAFYLFICLITYNQADPSLNRAAGNSVANAGGYPGALLADMVLQTLGVASAFLVMVPMIWGAKLLYGRRIPHLWLRVVTLLGALVLITGTLSPIEPPLSWPITSGLGGAIGMVLHDNFYKLFKIQTFILGMNAVAGFMLLLSLGVRWSEWVAFGRSLRQSVIVLSALAMSLKRGKSNAPKIKLVKSDTEEADDEEDEEEDKPRRQPRISKKEKARAQPKIQAALSLAPKRR